MTTVSRDERHMTGETSGGENLLRPIKPLFHAGETGKRIRFPRYDQEATRRDQPGEIEIAGERRGAHAVVAVLQGQAGAEGAAFAVSPLTFAGAATPVGRRMRGPAAGSTG